MSEVSEDVKREEGGKEEGKMKQKEREMRRYAQDKTGAAERTRGGRKAVGERFIRGDGRSGRGDGKRGES